MAKTTTANVRNRHGDLTVQHHETDSPLLPVAQLEHLHQFKPDAVDFVIEQTKIEADYRRAETQRLNTLVFVERVIGQVFALLIGLSGIFSGAYVAVNGQPTAGATIASLSLTGLAVVFLKGKMSKPPQN
ncbi:MAG: hypothetical protein WCL34_14000 [Methylococcaceae bacterium]|jgi:hypothetical protein